MSDTSLFVYKDGDRVAYLLLYVDDIILTASSTAQLQHITVCLHLEFAMMDLGDLHFLGISVTHSSDGLFLSQHNTRWTSCSMPAWPRVTQRRPQLTLEPSCRPPRVLRGQPL